jgi:excisionase family DNA binding protein
MPKATDDRVWSVKESAEYLGLSEKTVRREISAKNIRVMRLGPGKRRIGIHRSEINRYLMSRA